MTKAEQAIRALKTATKTRGIEYWARSVDTAVIRYDEDKARVFAFSDGSELVATGKGRNFKMKVRKG